MNSEIEKGLLAFLETKKLTFDDLVDYVDAKYDEYVRISSLL